MVAGRAIKVPAFAFATAAGTIIDSSTTFSRLPPSAYAALRSSFRSAMGRYRYKRAPSSPIFDTCYDFTGHETVRIPAVELVLAGGGSKGDRSVLLLLAARTACGARGISGVGSQPSVVSPIPSFLIRTSEP